MKYYLSFTLSPVQEFVAAARTTRDLWTGSYLLSWLTGHAINSIGAEKLLLPSLDEGHPLLQAIKGNLRHDSENEHSLPSFLIPTIPNTFVAVVESADSLDDCKKAVQIEWNRICESVHSEFDKALKKRALNSKWHAFWNEQVENYWNIQVVVVEMEKAQSVSPPFVPKGLNEFQTGIRYVGRLAAAKKQVRHFPPHEIYWDDTGSGNLIEDTRPKCAMFGSMAQMGPIAERGKSQMTLSREFWGNGLNDLSLGGTRLQRKDRLCAVALVKRFAWASYFKPKFSQQIPKESIDQFDFPDIDTICAAQWLEKGGIEQKKIDNWSGHWLRWKKPDEGSDPKRLDGTEPCPSTDVWTLIEGKKKERVPSYYAALMLDGDKMGDTLNRCDDAIKMKKVSKALETFASKRVTQIIERFRGKLVYAGGDDVLALLPAEHALASAKELAQAFSKLEFPDRQNHPPHCTVAIVIAHYKTPLHTVLAKVRESERDGKATGGNCLALTIMRRSGEETTNTVNWIDGDVDKLAMFVQWFKREPTDGKQGSRDEKGETDRWVYRFRQILNDLPDDGEAIKVELDRLLDRAELQEKTRQSEFSNFHQTCHRATGEDPASTAKQNGERFAQLIQAASFIARDEGR